MIDFNRPGGFTNRSAICANGIRWSTPAGKLLRRSPQRGLKLRRRLTDELEKGLQAQAT
jgi:hypothetical protein